MRVKVHAFHTYLCLKAALWNVLVRNQMIKKKRALNNAHYVMDAPAVYICEISQEQFEREFGLCLQWPTDGPVGVTSFPNESSKILFDPGGMDGLDGLRGTWTKIPIRRAHNSRRLLLLPCFNKHSYKNLVYAQFTTKTKTTKSYHERFQEWVVDPQWLC